MKNAEYFQTFSPNGVYRTKDHIERIWLDKTNRLGMRYIGDCTWVSEWCGHARKIMNLYLLKGDSAIIQWGWNFDFVPEVHGSVLKYFRTEKSASIQVQQLPQAFVDSADWNEFRIPMHADNLNKLEEEVLRVWSITESQILEWYARVNSAGQMITELDRQIAHGKYYRLFLVEQNYMKAFLLAAAGDTEQAVPLLRQTRIYTSAAEPLREKITAKLHSCVGLKGKLL